MTPPRTVTSGQEHRILIAITPQEQAMFLPDMEWTGTLGHPCRLEDSRPFDAPRWEQLLRDYRPTALVSAWSTPALPAAWIAGSDASLRYVCHLVGSARHLVPRLFLERGGLLTNWGGLAGETVAEHALLLALSALRRQPAWMSIITGPNTAPGRPASARLGTRTLRGRRVGVHGFGYVARSLVRLLKPFDVEIAAFSAGVPPSLMQAAGVAPCDSLETLAARSDVFFECEALNPSTAGSIGASVIDALPAGAVFVNVGRGPVVDEAPLLAAARAGRIQIALDVVVHDPVGPDSPFLSVDGAILSPHIAGPTADQFPDCGKLALANLARHLRGEPPEGLISPELFDRAT